MPLSSLDLVDFRSFEKIHLSLHPQRNLIFGGNAAGKSSLLEAIQFLSTSKSNRATTQQRLVRNGAGFFLVRGTIIGPQRPISLSVRYGNGHKQLQIDGLIGPKTSDLARALPVLAATPEGHYEFQRESKIRRGVLDLILFHVEQEYQTLWTRYHRVLAQRNAELRKTTDLKRIFAWNEELAIHGESIQDRRQEVIKLLGKYFSDITKLLLPALGEIELVLKTGWNHEKGLFTALTECAGLDISRGYTQSGPHRNDLSFIFNKLNSYQELSHGQKKLIYLALRSAQAFLLHEHCGIESIFLLDDVAAELDEQSLKRVYDLLGSVPAQIIATSLDTKTWIEIWPDFRSFHVKHGFIETAEQK